jgi:BirA family biotin operon repressor/biotin-[acetyl-CoA-carboxylase] ligase
MQLHPDAERSGVRLIAYDTLGSTNAEALARGRVGERGPLWIAAARQTAGRGRRGNAWVSEPGNLYASLLLTDAAPAAHLPELCFVVALAVRDAVSHFLVPPLKGEGRIAEGNPGCGHSSNQSTPTRRASHVDLPLAGGGMENGLKLKWPNDLLLDGAKLAGILIEAESLGGKTLAAAGIGVNCVHHPIGLAYPATSLSAYGESVGPERVLTELSRTVLGRLAQWDRGAGFAEIRSEWLSHAAGVGGDIQVRLSGRELTGTFESLDSMGRLMLRLPDGGLEAITAGEVFAPARVHA